MTNCKMCNKRTSNVKFKLCNNTECYIKYAREIGIKLFIQKMLTEPNINVCRKLKGIEDSFFSTYNIRKFYPLDIRKKQPVCEYMYVVPITIGYLFIGSNFAFKVNAENVIMPCYNLVLVKEPLSAIKCRLNKEEHGLLAPFLDALDDRKKLDKYGNIELIKS